MLRGASSFKLQASKLLWQHVLLLATSFSIILPHEAKANTVNGNMVIGIGAIIDVGTRTGIEEKIAMVLAREKFNNESKTHKLSIFFRNPYGDPLLAARSAEKLIKEKKVNVIVGMQRWEEAAIVAEIGSKNQVPILSLAAPSTSPPLASSRWPFLIRMAPNDSSQMKCIAEIMHYYNWRRAIAIYEDHLYSSNLGKLSLLSEALHDVGSQIEYRLVLPPFSSLSNPKEIVSEELMKVSRDTQSRVFIVLECSLPMVIHLFREATKIGLVGRDTVWILTDSITSYLDSINTSVIYSMGGAIGVKAFNFDNSSPYQDFYVKFRQRFRSEIPEEDSFEPGFHALRAYDSIAVIKQAIERMHVNASSTQKEFLDQLLTSNFTGLSGKIGFREGELSSSPPLRIVNVVGKRYQELDYWTLEMGFTSSLITRDDEMRNRTEFSGFKGFVKWPGDLKKRNPRGWAMPIEAKPMKIGVPGRTSFEKFVKVVNVSGEIKYKGFCIEVFQKVLEILDYALPHEFEAFNGTYEELVNHVHDKTYDAIIGDVTILANRSTIVEFTQPYTESGLSMIIPTKSKESAWMFMRPFTWQMWMVTGAILIYTMLVVWFLEHQTNPEFEGPWRNQIATALWFTFCSLFFAHREKIHSNLTRMVLVVWLFVVLILNSSYTANLTSMLTVQKLQPVIDIDMIKRNNWKVGCDGDSFVRTYLENVLEFKPENILNVNSEYKYKGEFESNNISAAFLEVPYQKVFINTYCKGYTTTAPTYRFGGLGFVFRKGSPMATDVSKAILTLSENGQLKDLEGKWFAPSLECSSNVTNSIIESLSLQNFWGLYVISGATSTSCMLLFVGFLLKKYCHYRKGITGNASRSDESVWIRTVKLAKYLYHGEVSMSRESPTFAPSPDINEWGSLRWNSPSPSDSPENIQASSPVVIGLANLSEFEI